MVKDKQLKEQAKTKPHSFLPKILLEGHVRRLIEGLHRQFLGAKNLQTNKGHVIGHFFLTNHILPTILVMMN